jgi:hypothetical protein
LSVNDGIDIFATVNGGIGLEGRNIITAVTKYPPGTIEQAGAWMRVRPEGVRGGNNGRERNDEMRSVVLLAGRRDR